MAISDFSEPPLPLVSRCDLGYIWYFYIDYCAPPPRLFTFALLNEHGDALHVVAILKANELSIIPMQAALHMF